MQNKKALLISLLVALIAVMMVFAYISKKEKSLMELGTPIKVVIAIKDIPEGTKLDETLLEEKEVPKKYIQPGAVGELSEVIDRAVMVPILKGTQILGSMFVTTEEEGIAQKIPKEMRGFSIAVSDVTAVAGLIQVGDFVDILVTVEVGSFKEGRNVSEEIMTKTILENVLVLAVNQASSKAARIKPMSMKQKAPGSVFSERDKAQGQREKLRTLTLALSPEDTQKINLAQEIGTVSVSLRSRWDKGEKKVLEPLNAKDFLGVEKSVVPRTRPAWIEIRGSEQIYR